MAKNTIVISCDIRETRVALIENGVIAELHIERKGSAQSTVGNVYLGKVTRVLPGLQAAFVDIGQERAAFLHVEDLIRPDDFDAYLAGGRKHAMGEGGEEVVSEDEADAIVEKPALAPPTAESRNGETREAPIETPRSPTSDEQARRAERDREDALDRERDSELEEAGAPELEALIDDDEDDRPGLDEEGDDEDRDRDDEDDADRDGEGDDGNEDEDAERDRGEGEENGEGDLDEEAVPSGIPAPLESLGEVASESSIHSAPTLPELPEPSGQPEVARANEIALDDGDLPGFTVSEPGEPVPHAVPPPAHRDRGRRRGRGRGRRGRDRDGREGRDDREARGGGRGRGRGGERGDRRNGMGVPGRISKSTPIREVVKEGQEIIVQVSKDPIGTKGARCTSHISLPGRYVVYLPTVDHFGVSKRIGSEKERARLREAIEGMRPPTGGLIVRTVAEGLTKKQLKQDVGYLVRLWGEIAKKREGARAPAILSSELDIVLKTARDLFTDEVEQIVIDDKHQYDRLCRFVEMFAPDRIKDIVYYNENEPIFDAYGIEDEIARALSRKVPLPSGGYLIIDQAEALTAIDVNTGRFVGRGSKDMEETILKTNLEAVEEIAYQLRFRNIGGLIILDLIDMEKHSNREKVRKRLDELLQKDKAKTTLNRISELGLIEMTRKRTRESLGRILHEPCFYCDGTGQLQSKETIAFEILREIRRKKADLPGYTVVVNAHPAVVDVLQTTEKQALADAENRFMRKISLVPQKGYHLEQFDLTGK
jgi:ribonuclease G